MTTYLIDDMRSFKDGRDCVIARTPKGGVAALAAQPTRIDELWLDHDMGMDYKTNEEFDIWPVVDYMLERANDGVPVDVDIVYVHTSNPAGGQRMVQALERGGYRVLRTNDRDLEWNLRSTKALLEERERFS